MDDKAAEMSAAQARGARDVVMLRRIFAWLLLVALLLQIVLADYVFYRYGASRDWDLPAEALSAWLAAVVVQVVSLVYAIVKYLFSTQALEYARPETAKEKKKRPGPKPDED